MPTGIDFGTVTVVMNTAAFEVTTLRSDVETDGRHATVRFGTSFQEDAERRDFTINAMFEDKDGKIYDYFGGTRTVDVHVRRLRMKIERHGTKFIQTVRGVGYKFGE